MEEIVSKLVEKSEDGVCAYVYDLKKLQHHAQKIKKSLPPFCQFFYAMKANPDLEIVKTVASIVDGIEVASIGEVKKAKNLTNLPLIFGAPAKKYNELVEIVNGAVTLVNIESALDVDRIQTLAKEAKKKVSAVIRVNLRENVSESRLKMSGVPTQFGVDEYEVSKIIEKVLSCENIDLKGFHFHAMSNNLDAKAHIAFISLCMKKALHWQKEYSFSLEVVNVGGGIGVNYANPTQPFAWEQFIEGLFELYYQYGHLGFKLILELGRYVVADCGYYVAEVIDLKKNHDHYFALIRGGSHHFRLPAAWKMSHPFIIIPTENWEFPFPRPQMEADSVTIAGELCTPNDVLAFDAFVEKLQVGDLILFQLAGAYGWTISHHEFLSHPMPEIVYIR
ncbi:type III PLP-dependent enzyme [Bacillus weihaiensis]|uniref:type III PLP-dependent enzyme n=1 Tax=Bacillus weihaiensis TaxID=1547283 RepID=UPI0023554C7C|nr:type III PLP-dependent enzyme [Bacillus weihaiensis]